MIFILLFLLILNTEGSSYLENTGRYTFDPTIELSTASIWWYSVTNSTSGEEIYKSVIKDWISVHDGYIWDNLDTLNSDKCWNLHVNSTLDTSYSSSTSMAAETDVSNEMMISQCDDYCTDDKICVIKITNSRNWNCYIYSLTPIFTSGNSKFYVRDFDCVGDYNTYVNKGVLNTIVEQGQCSPNAASETYDVTSFLDCRMKSSKGSWTRYDGTNRICTIHPAEENDLTYLDSDQDTKCWIEPGNGERSELFEKENMTYPVYNSLFYEPLNPSYTIKYECTRYASIQLSISRSYTYTNIRTTNLECREYCALIGCKAAYLYSKTATDTKCYFYDQNATGSSPVTEGGGFIVDECVDVNNKKCETYCNSSCSGSCSFYTYDYVSETCHVWCDFPVEYGRNLKPRTDIPEPDCDVIWNPISSVYSYDNVYSILGVSLGYFENCTDVKWNGFWQRSNKQVDNFVMYETGVDINPSLLRESFKSKIPEWFNYSENMFDSSGAHGLILQPDLIYLSSSDCSTYLSHKTTCVDSSVGLDELVETYVMRLYCSTKLINFPIQMIAMLEADLRCIFLDMWIQQYRKWHLKVLRYAEYVLGVVQPITVKGQNVAVLGLLNKVMAAIETLLNESPSIDRFTIISKGINTASIENSITFAVASVITNAIEEVGTSIKQYIYDVFEAQQVQYENLINGINTVNQNVINGITSVNKFLEDIARNDLNSELLAINASITEAELEFDSLDFERSLIINKIDNILIRISEQQNYMDQSFNETDENFSKMTSGVDEFYECVKKDEIKKLAVARIQAITKVVSTACAVAFSVYSGALPLPNANSFRNPVSRIPNFGILGSGPKLKMNPIGGKSKPIRKPGSLSPGGTCNAIVDSTNDPYDDTPVGGYPTKNPTASAPQVAPTKRPTWKATRAPTQKVSASESTTLNQISTAPRTYSPTDVKITRAPTKKPTGVPPTPQPTLSPVSGPTTAHPTLGSKNYGTPVPTKSGEFYFEGQTDPVPVNKVYELMPVTNPSQLNARPNGKYVVNLWVRKYADNSNNPYKTVGVRAIFDPSTGKYYENNMRDHGWTEYTSTKFASASITGYIQGDNLQRYKLPSSSTGTLTTQYGDRRRLATRNHKINNCGSKSSGGTGGNVAVSNSKKDKNLRAQVTLALQQHKLVTQKESATIEKKREIRGFIFAGSYGESYLSNYVPVEVLQIVSLVPGFQAVLPVFSLATGLVSDIGTILNYKNAKANVEKQYEQNIKQAEIDFDKMKKSLGELMNYAEQFSEEVDVLINTFTIPDKSVAESSSSYTWQLLTETVSSAVQGSQIYSDYYEAANPDPAARRMLFSNRQEHEYYIEKSNKRNLLRMRQSANPKSVSTLRRSLGDKDGCDELQTLGQKGLTYADESLKNFKTIAIVGAMLQDDIMDLLTEIRKLLVLAKRMEAQQKIISYNEAMKEAIESNYAKLLDRQETQFAQIFTTDVPTITFPKSKFYKGVYDFAHEHLRYLCSIYHYRYLVHLPECSTNIYEQIPIDTTTTSQDLQNTVTNTFKSITDSIANGVSKANKFIRIPITTVGTLLAYFAGTGTVPNSESVYPFILNISNNVTDYEDYYKGCFDRMYNIEVMETIFVYEKYNKDSLMDININGVGVKRPNPYFKYDDTWNLYTFNISDSNLYSSEVILRNYSCTDNVNFKTLPILGDNVYCYDQTFPSTNDGPLPVPLFGYYELTLGNLGTSTYWDKLFSDDQLVMYANINYLKIGSLSINCPAVNFDTATSHPTVSPTTGSPTVPPTVPAGWTCDIEWWGADDGCDCGCGAWDTDCDNITESTVSQCYNINNEPINIPKWNCLPDGQCNVTVPDQWTCDPNLYATHDGSCNCECGVWDPNCYNFNSSNPLICNNGTTLSNSTSYVSYCDFDTVTCSEVEIFVINNVPQGWDCNPTLFNNSNGCDCGCGSWDPDCDIIGSDLYCNQINLNRLLAPDYLTQCSNTSFVCIEDIPTNWTCMDYQYNQTGICHCGCGQWDPACENATNIACSSNNGSSFVWSKSTDTYCSNTTLTCEPVDPVKPNDWICESTFWNDGTYCDCGCSTTAIDPDCLKDNTELQCVDPVLGYYDNNLYNKYCETQYLFTCQTRVPDEWFCPPNYYNASDLYCDCCGAYDPDCNADIYEIACYDKELNLPISSDGLYCNTNTWVCEAIPTTISPSTISPTTAPSLNTGSPTTGTPTGTPTSPTTGTTTGTPTSTTTGTPTTSPTYTPTTSPTDTPTTNPSTTSTSSPSTTQNNTNSPTNSPTNNPTNVGETYSPTGTPTTETPTTGTPTTGKPTNSPTDTPTTASPTTGSPTSPTTQSNRFVIPMVVERYVTDHTMTAILLTTTLLSTICCCYYFCLSRKNNKHPHRKFRVVPTIDLDYDI